MKKYKVTLKGESWEFTDQSAARDKIRVLMDAGCFFLETSSFEDGEKPEKPEPAPAAKPEEKTRGPYKKKSGPEAGNDHPGRKFTKNVIEFLKQNCDTKDNKMLAKAVEAKFGFKTTHHSVAWQMTQNKIKRKNGYHKKSGDEKYYDPGKPEDLEGVGTDES